MYFIRKRSNVKGEPSYQIIVKTAAYNQETVQRSMTWKPNRKLTEKQLSFALQRVAKEFEAQVIEAVAGRKKPVATEDTFFNEFAEYWLKNIENNASASYYAGMTNAYHKIKSITEGYRLMDFNPLTIEEIYKKIEELRNIVYHVIAKDCLKEMIRKQYTSYNKFCKASEIGTETLKTALKKEYVSIDTARKIAKCLSVGEEEIFHIEKETLSYKSNYVEGMRKVVRLTLSLAARLGIIKKNYANKLYVTYRHPDADKVKSMTIEEAQRLLKICESLDIRKKLILTFILYTGVRKGEICGLNWSDFDLNGKKVQIVRQYEAVSKKGLIVKEPKTEAGIRELELSDHLIEVIKEYREWYERKREAIGDDWKGEDYFLVSKNGSRLHPTQIRNWLDEALELAGLPHYTVHSLRHTNISILIAAGIPPVTVAGRVGHKKATTTMNIYADFLGSSDEEASVKINSYFAERTKKPAI